MVPRNVLCWELYSAPRGTLNVSDYREGQGTNYTVFMLILVFIRVIISIYITNSVPRTVIYRKQRKYVIVRLVFVQCPLLCVKA